MATDFAGAVCGVLLLAAFGAAQDSLELKVKDKVAVPGASASVMVAPFSCDGDGNVFLRPFAGRSLPPEVLRISADGTKTTHFSVASAPGFEHSERPVVVAFAVGPDGDVYLATAKPPGDSYLLRFGKDGQYRSSIKLDLGDGAAVRQLAVFSSGLLLISGSRAGDKTGPVASFAGVFDDTGKMLAPVKFPHPNRKTAGLPSSPNAEELSFDKLKSALATSSLSMAESGGDGNVYFVRHADPAIAYVVSPAGEVLREIPLDAPKEAGFELQAAKVAGGRLAIMCEGHGTDGGTSAIKVFVYDIHTAKRVANYFHQNFEIGNALACYSADDVFTFISSDETGKMLLVHAGAR